MPAQTQMWEYTETVIEELPEFLEQGWEPYAVTIQSNRGVAVHHLRRKTGIWATVTGKSDV